MDVIGKVAVNITYKQQWASLALVVVAEEGSPPQLIEIGCVEFNSTGNRLVQSNCLKDNLLINTYGIYLTNTQKFSRMNLVPFSWPKLRYNSNQMLIKPQPVPLSLKPAIKEELQRLAGICWCHRESTKRQLDSTEFQKDGQIAFVEIIRSQST